MTESEPSLVAVAGDWHGNWRWAVHVVDEVQRHLPDDGSPRLLLQLGDFGFRFAERYRQPLGWLNQELKRVGMECWFIDGNHEDWPDLAKLTDCDRDEPPTDPGVRVTSNIQYLPRGTRWTWAGKTWLACGGAASIDRAIRVRHGWDWYPEEEITREQAASITTAGKADVMVTHDVSLNWLPANLAPVHELPETWQAELPRCHAHSARLGEIVNTIQPTRIFHGHYHVNRDDWYQPYWGACRVTGLCEDGFQGNWTIVDVNRVCSSQEGKEEEG